MKVKLRPTTQALLEEHAKANNADVDDAANNLLLNALKSHGQKAAAPDTKQKAAAEALTKQMTAIRNRKATIYRGEAR